MDKNYKIIERCHTLTVLLTQMKDEYKKSTIQQKAFIETIIGAAIWYLPKNENTFSGYISVKALESIKNGLSDISDEHIYPRKIAARELITKAELVDENIYSLFENKYGKICITTKHENRTAMQYQKKDLFENPNVVYEKAGIEFIKITKEEYKRLKKNKTIINEILTRERCSVEI
jgi:hypothetical protein